MVKFLGHDFLLIVAIKFHLSKRKRNFERLGLFIGVNVEGGELFEPSYAWGDGSS